MVVTAEVSDSSGIASVTANMGGIETISLSLTQGTVYEGLWQATWLVHDTETKVYVTTIHAIDALGREASATVEWSDPTYYGNQFLVTATSSIGQYERCQPEERSALHRPVNPDRNQDKSLSTNRGSHFTYLPLWSPGR